MRLRQLGFAALGLLAFAVVSLGVAFALEDRAVGGRPAPDGRVARNVVLVDRQVGGMTAPQLQAEVDSLADAYARSTVQVRAPGSNFEVDAAELGLRLDHQATTGSVLDVGRRRSVLDRFGDWSGSFFTERSAPVSVQVDEAAVARVTDALDPGRVPATEPSITFGGEGFQAVPGKPGRAIAAQDLVVALIRATRQSGRLPIVVEVERAPLAPRHDLAAAQQLALQADALTAEPLAVRAGTVEGKVAPAVLRTWVKAVPTPQGLTLAVESPDMLGRLAETVPGGGARPVDATFTIAGGRPQVVPGKPGTTCCAPEAAAVVAKAVLQRPEAAVDLPLKVRAPDLSAEEAAGLGIAQPIGTFTTSHPPGQPRVRNIHRIADLLRGQVIEPDEVFSVNRFIGPRTTGKGFVSAPVIQDGKFDEGIGGGISQFATTMFNAAFFAGLDFGEYQSHSIYIPRYPYGREATLSYPNPDLVIKNTLPHGVVIWPTYSATSITVTLWSTKSVAVQPAGQSKWRQGPCTAVSTKRSRTWADGRTAVDAVSALYRPGEGVDC